MASARIISREKAGFWAGLWNNHAKNPFNVMAFLKMSAQIHDAVADFPISFSIENILTNLENIWAYGL